MTAAAATPVLIKRDIATPLGPMVGVASERGLCMLEFADGGMTARSSGAVRRRAEPEAVAGVSEHLDLIERELAAYFRGRLRAFTVPLHWSGTGFQRQVWGELVKVAWGVTISYGELARRIGRPEASRAVARANGDNHIAIVVPCHRVVGSDGSLTGYGGGLDRKRRLLELEGAGSLFGGA